MLGLRNDGCQEDGLLGCQLRRAFFKVVGSSLLCSVDKRPPFHYVQIYFVHPVFGSETFRFYQPDDQGFFQFPGDVFVPVQEYVFYQLHGDGTSPTGKTFHFQVLYQCFTHGIGKKAPVIVEGSVFTLHHRHLQ